MSEPYYDHLKVPELKSLLRERGLQTTGKKLELIERLKDHDVKIKIEAGLILVFCKTMIGSFYDIWTYMVNNIKLFLLNINGLRKLFYRLHR